MGEKSMCRARFPTADPIAERRSVPAAEKNFAARTLILAVRLDLFNAV
jgi:hypothetical protein